MFAATAPPVYALLMLLGTGIRALPQQHLAEHPQQEAAAAAGADGGAAAGGPTLGGTDQGTSLNRQPRAGVLASFDFEEQSPVRSRLHRNICGLRRSSVPDVFTRIVGGTIAEPHEFPWQASIQWRFSWYNYHVCGATILNEYWLVTAAHCTNQFQAKDLIILAGLHNVKNTDGNEQKRDLDRVVEHWDYHTVTQENDIALLRVKKPFVIDGLKVSPACLPTPGQALGSQCVVSGWGKVTEKSSNSDELRKVVVPIISRQQCKENYRVIGYSGPISEKMICAGYSQGLKDACQGDSGGPFVCRGNDNRYILTGVVSWGVGCARPNVPGVYTEVSRYISWIKGIVHGGSSVTISHRAANDQTSLHLDDFSNMSADTLVFGAPHTTRQEDITGQDTDSSTHLLQTSDVVVVDGSQMNDYQHPSDGTHLTVN